MYLHDDYYYDGQQLGGLGKKLKKFVKKVAAPVAHIGAAIFTGGASLALSANIIKAQQERKAKEAQARAQAESDKAAIAAQEKVAMAQLQVAQGNVATAAAPTALTPSTAPPAGLVQQMMPMPTTTYVQSGGDREPMYETVPSSSGQPKWVVPAMIGGGGLLLALLLSKRR